MILMNERPARAGAGLLLAGLTLITAACSTAPVLAPGGGGVADYQSLSEARDAGLKLYDALRPVFDADAVRVRYAASLGAEQMVSSTCEARYHAAALRARCAALVAVIAVTEEQATGIASAQSRIGNLAQMLSRFAPGIGPLLGPASGRLAAAFAGGQSGPALTAPAQALIEALRADAPALFSLGRAARAEALEQADFAWLAEMDTVFDRAAERSVPSGLNSLAAFHQLSRRIEAMLVREEPQYGAASLYEVMTEGGRRLQSADIAAMAEAVARAEQRLASFDEIAEEWRIIAAAINDYDALLAAAGQGVGANGFRGAVEDRLTALFSLRAHSASLLTRLNQIGAVQ
ncbi:MAG: hypothetical protein AAF367_02295 [Pseudomonadota bacterium]